jgi:hypothetical protein
MAFVYRPQQEAKDDVVQGLVDYLSRSEIAKAFDAFFDDHCAAFADREDDQQEQKLEWTQIHSEYQILVEMKLDGFLKQSGLTATEVLERCRTSEATAQGGRYIFMFVASTDYAYFASTMKQRSLCVYGKDAKAEAKYAIEWLPPIWVREGNTSEEAKSESKGDIDIAEKAAAAK